MPIAPQDLAAWNVRHCEAIPIQVLQPGPPELKISEARVLVCQKHALAYCYQPALPCRVRSFRDVRFLRPARKTGLLANRRHPKYDAIPPAHLAKSNEALGPRQHPTSRSSIMESAICSASTERERGHHRGSLGPDVVCSDQELRLQAEGRKRVTEAASTAFPRRPANRRGFAFLRHGSCLPAKQCTQALGRDNGAPAYPHRFQAPSSDMIIDPGPTQA